MFWIPKGWVPYYGEWLISFPRAPLGSVSINTWVLACNAIISLVGDALVAVIALVTTSAGSTSQKRGTAIKVPSEKAQSKGAKSKKEL